MAYLILFPFVAQMIAMSVDEFYFHHKRKLPLWERWGHPLDTVSFLLCSFWVLLQAPNYHSLKIYLLLALFSCFFVTKDEWVHSRSCSSGEQWIHSLLFILHPLFLLALALLWPVLHQQELGFLHFSSHEERFLKIGFFLHFFTAQIFLMYQVIYWNFLWREKNGRSTSTATTR